MKKFLSILFAFCLLALIGCSEFKEKVTSKLEQTSSALEKTSSELDKFESDLEEIGKKFESIMSSLYN